MLSTMVADSLQMWLSMVACVVLLSLWNPLKPAQGLGVNWGDQASHPLPPDIVVSLLKANNIQQVKLFDSNSSVLNALAGSGIEVMVAIPNDLLLSMTNAAQARAWVQNNVVRYLSSGGTSIKYVAVGNEPFLTAYNGSYLNITYPALVNVQQALINENLGDEIKATVPMNADVLSVSSVPSGTTFRDDISALMLQIVTYLGQNNCPFVINIYPFISLYKDENFPIDYAFFNGYSNPVVDGQYTYQNVFDASYDSLVMALQKVGFGNMSILVGEIGWPTDGQIFANLSLSKKFNQGFLDHVTNTAGTPRTSKPIQFYLFSLIDEDQKSIQPGNFERHWGIFQYDGTLKYTLSLPGSNGKPLTAATGVQYLTKQWCILNTQAGDMSSLGDSITYACSNSDCTSLVYGASCYPYLTAAGNASYAFNQYFQIQNQDLGTCYFNGLGKITAQNPSVNICKFIVQMDLTTSASFKILQGTTALVFSFSFTILLLLYLEIAQRL